MSALTDWNAPWVVDWPEAVSYLRNPATTQDQAVAFYAAARARIYETPGVYWRHVNQAISDRWGVTALRAIKARAGEETNA